MFDLLTTPVDTDIAYNWITVLFPKDANSPYAQAFATFTGMLSFFGGLFLAWHVLQGIVLSAYKGKVMGERFHQIWAPLRVVLGFGMLVPISGGFSSIHILLRDVVGVAAVQMGNTPIKAYITAITTVKLGPDGKPLTKEIEVSGSMGRFVFDKVIEKQVCYAVSDGLNSSVWRYFTDDTKLGIKEAPVAGEPAGIIPGWTASDGDYAWDYGTCGALTFVIPTPNDVSNMAYNYEDFKTFASERRLAMQALVTEAKKVVNTKNLSTYFATHDVVNMGTSDILTELITTGVISPNYAGIKAAAVDKFNDTVSTSAQKIYTKMMANSGKEMTDRIDKFGFMAAGSFERALSKASAVTVNAANAMPKISNANLAPKLDAAYRTALVAVVGSADAPGQNKNPAGTSASMSTDPFAAVMSWLAPSIADMQQHRKSESKDPIGDMITFGHNLLTIWEVGVVSMLTIHEALLVANLIASGTKSSVDSGVGNFLSGGGLGALANIATIPFAVAMDAFSFVMNWITPLLVVIMIVGILHAFVLPMLPMMMVFVMGVSWLIMFLEAAIAGVLWAFVFIRMDGEDFVDRVQAQGASLLFNLFLRPAIGMLAFIGGLLLLPTLMDSLTILWDDGFNSQTTPDLIHFVQWIVGIVMYTWMQWHLTLRLFGLIPTIADRVGSWMGFNSHGYNEGAETTQVVGALVAAGSAGKMMAPPMPKGGGGGGGGGRGPTPPAPPKPKDDDGKDDKGGPDGGGDGGGGGSGGGGSGGGRGRGPSTGQRTAAMGRASNASSGGGGAPSASAAEFGPRGDAGAEADQGQAKRAATSSHVSVHQRAAAHDRASNDKTYLDDSDWKKIV